MQGYGVNRGVNPRALEELFAMAAERAGMFEYELSVSLLEIYNENIRDLVEPDDEKGQVWHFLKVFFTCSGGDFVMNDQLRHIFGRVLVLFLIVILWNSASLMFEFRDKNTHMWHFCDTKFASDNVHTWF